MARAANSSSRWLLSPSKLVKSGVDGEGAGHGEALSLLRKLKRLLVEVFGLDLKKDMLDRLSREEFDSGNCSSGLGLSLVGEGMRPRVRGADWPWNQVDILSEEMGLVGECAESGTLWSEILSAPSTLCK